MEAGFDYKKYHYEYVVDGNAVRKVIVANKPIRSETEPVRKIYRESISAATERSNTVSQPIHKEKIAAVPQPVKEDKPELQTDTRPARAINPGRSIDFLSITIMSAAIIFTIIACILYLQAQAEYTQLNKEITILRQSVQTAQDKNEAELGRLNSEVNLDYIYEVAVGELGMVFPNENTVLYYEGETDGYVRQYESIPQINAGLTLNELFGY